MKTLVIAALALGTVLAGCGSSGQTADPTVSVESADASGGVAADDGIACPSGPPARGVMVINAFDDQHGVVGQIYNESGATLWLWSRKWPGICQLDAGRSAGFAVGSSAVITVSSVQDYGKSPGIGIRIEDTPGLSPAVTTWFQRPNLSRCESNKSEVKTVGLKEDSEQMLEGVAQGSVLVTRLPNSKEINREWLPSGNADNFSRIDLYVKAVGIC